MATLNQFQQYSQGENTVTNNVLLMFSLLYDINPRYYEEYMNGLIEETDFYGVVPDFRQQVNNNGKGFIDGRITLRPSTIIIETKLNALEWVDKLLKYTDSFHKGEVNLLFHLSSISYDETTIKQIEDRLVAEKVEKNVKFFSVTFEDLVAQLKSLHEQYLYEPQILRLYEKFEEYCQNMNLLPASRQILRAMACGESFDLNVKHKFYFDLARRGYSHFNYLGIYKHKAVRFIGTVENMIVADWSEEEGLIIKNKTSEVSSAQKEWLTAAIKDSILAGWNVSKNHRFFLLNDFHETKFRKESSGGIFRVRYFNLENYNVKEGDSVEQIAEELKKHIWEKG